MKIELVNISELLIIEPKLHCDSRGFFYESFNQKFFSTQIRSQTVFVQDNHSRTSKNVLRGLHFQVEKPQGKLVRVLSGKIFDVAVDLRKSSPTYGKWVSEILSSENRKQFWIPEGFAHGFLVMSDFAEVLYKTTDFYYPEFERCIIWNDETLSIDWPIKCEPILSQKDSEGISFLSYSDQLLNHD